VSEPRSIEYVRKSYSTLEGAGVHLKRAFADDLAKRLDPFLLLDDFHSNDPGDYIAGFPWHPHRGIETVTYMISGNVEHGDSMGNSGTISSGDVQWMTAGGGIIHQEMPQRHSGFFQGFQLWANLPSKSKMMNPRYRGVTQKEVKTATPSKGVDIKVIAGKVGKVEGPVGDLVVDADYVDITLKPDVEWEHPLKKSHTALAYVFEGAGSYGDASKNDVDAETLVMFGSGDSVVSKAGKNGMRFLLVSGQPIGEPIAWRGPIVMNTWDEIEVAFQEYWDGTFLSHVRPSGTL
jgi:redox-sensitive bicupin YhaK (pirin superfamily)